MNKFLQSQLASVLRGLLKGLGGYLVLHGFLDQQQAQTLTELLLTALVNALPFILAQVWSYIDKQAQKNVVAQTEQMVDVALNLPAGTPRAVLEEVVSGKHD